MQPRSNLSHGAVLSGFPGIGASAAFLLLGCWGIALLAWAAPGIIRQIARPCAECYVSSFGPPFQPYGHPAPRSDEQGVATKPPPGRSDDTSPGGAWGWLDLRDTVAVGRSTLFGTGRISQDAAAFFALNDAGAPRERLPGGDHLQWQLMPGRPGSDAAAGAPAKRGMTPGRPWDDGTPRILPRYRSYSATVFAAGGVPDGSPDVTGAVAREAVAAQAGTGGGDRFASAPAGSAADIGAYWNLRVTPAWHVAVEKDLQGHFLQIRTYRADDNMAPAAGHFSWAGNTVTDTGADANYQFFTGLGGRLSADASVIHEPRLPGGGNRQPGANGFDTVRAGAAWSIGETIAPAIHFFRTVGSPESFQGSWPGARPDSAGVIAEVAYMPWGAWASPIQFLNLRIAARYVAYTEVNGTGHGASGNNAVTLSLFGNLHF